jgi:hypothetical protein
MKSVVQWSMRAIAGFASLAAVAASEQQGGGYGFLTNENDCMFARSINNWRALDDRNLIVWSPSRKDPYVVTLSRSISGLKFSDTLAFEDHNNDSRICGFGMDKVISTGGAFPERASIIGIRRLDGSEEGPMAGLYELFSRRSSLNEAVPLESQRLRNQ